ncbi:MAG TPA: alpha/beta hydrolase [Candidatus Limnocylindrales bacterium]|nr:alpha/beta hydrolase [Candidatus Limnocylindrales bacterium]
MRADPTLVPESLVVPVDTGERIHYLDWGRPEPADRPPLLLVHGLSATARHWTPIARRLAGRVHLLAPDLRGHGLSDAPRGGYDLESLAFDVLTVLTASGYGPDAGGAPAVVAGHGFGAQVAAAAGVLAPSAVAGVALVDGGWEDVAEVTGQEPAEFLRGLEEPPEVLRSMAAYLADRRDYDPASWDDDQETAARAAVEEKHAGHVAPRTRPFALRGCVEAMFSYRPARTLSALEVPLLALVAAAGTADDEEGRQRLLALEEIADRRTAAGRPPTVVRTLPGAGHNLMRYRPGEVAAALLQLLESATPTSGGRRGGQA